MKTKKEEMVDGMMGWREFAASRNQLLNLFHLAKAQSSSDHVKVEHGNVAEAEFREWLAGFLPRRFAVTSGFIISNNIQRSKDRTDHFDVIIYDAMNAPVLWQRQRTGDLAIPAKYVFGVIEVKSQFCEEAIVKGLKKLRSLKAFQTDLPPQFFSSLLFFELMEEQLPKVRLLNHFLSELPIGFTAALILETGVNKDLVGYLTVENSSELDEGEKNPNEALVKDVDKEDYYISSDGALACPPFFGAELVCVVAGSWLVIKTSYATRRDGAIQASLRWTRNNFAKFANRLLFWLEHGPIEPIKVESMYGYVFDRIRVEKVAKGKNVKGRRKESFH